MNLPRRPQAGFNGGKFQVRVRGIHVKKKLFAGENQGARNNHGRKNQMEVPKLFNEAYHEEIVAEIRKGLVPKFTITRRLRNRTDLYL